MMPILENVQFHRYSLPNTQASWLHRRFKFETDCPNQIELSFFQTHVFCLSAWLMLCFERSGAI